MHLTHGNSAVGMVCSTCDIGSSLLAIWASRQIKLLIMAGEEVRFDLLAATVPAVQMEPKQWLVAKGQEMLQEHGAKPAVPAGHGRQV